MLEHKDSYITRYDIMLAVEAPRTNNLPVKDLRLHGSAHGPTLFYFYCYYHIMSVAETTENEYIKQNLNYVVNSKLYSLR